MERLQQVACQLNEAVSVLTREDGSLRDRLCVVLCLLRRQFSEADFPADLREHFADVRQAWLADMTDRELPCLAEQITILAHLVSERVAPGKRAELLAQSQSHFLAIIPLPETQG